MHESGRVVGDELLKSPSSMLERRARARVEELPQSRSPHAFSQRLLEKLLCHVPESSTLGLRSCDFPDELAVGQNLRFFGVRHLPDVGVAGQHHEALDAGGDQRLGVREFTESVGQDRAKIPRNSRDLCDWRRILVDPIQKPATVSTFNFAVPILQIDQQYAVIGDDDEIDLSGSAQIEDQIQIGESIPRVGQ